MPEVFSLDKLGPLPAWEDKDVQSVYRILCSEEVPPEDQHWEGWVARKIVQQLRAYAAAEVAKERERCALLCEKLAVDMQQESADRGCPFGELIPDGDEAAEMCAKAIRSQHD